MYQLLLCVIWEWYNFFVIILDFFSYFLCPFFNIIVLESIIAKICQIAELCNYRHQNVIFSSALWHVFKRRDYVKSNFHFLTNWPENISRDIVWNVFITHVFSIMCSCIIDECWWHNLCSFILELRVILYSCSYNFVTIYIIERQRISLQQRELVN